jgi:RNA polymerase sigma-70 factor (ECF subfamily)
MSRVRFRVDPDAELVDELRREDADATEHLVERYADRVYRLAVRVTGSPADAEEVAQDALWTVSRKIQMFRGDSSLGSWIYRITANAAYQKLRCRAHRRDDISLDEVLPLFHKDGRHVGPIRDWSASINDPVVQTELRVALDAAIEDLPAHYRTVIVLHDVEGLSLAEVADSVGITVATAKSRAHRARLFLRKRLSMFMADATGSTSGESQ